MAPGQSYFCQIFSRKYWSKKLTTVYSITGDGQMRPFMQNLTLNYCLRRTALLNDVLEVRKICETKNSPKNFTTLARITFCSLSSFRCSLVCIILENNGSSMAKNHLTLHRFWSYFSTLSLQHFFACIAVCSLV